MNKVREGAVLQQEYHKTGNDMTECVIFDLFNDVTAISLCAN